MKEGEFIIGLDIGTTSTKGMLFRIGGDVQDLYSKDHPILYPEEGMVEEDPEDVLQAVLKVVKTLMERNKISRDSVICIVFGGILHSIVAVDRSGTPISRAMIWADSRSTSESEELRKSLDVEEVKKRTGCTIHPLYFPPRLAWIKNYAGETFEKAHKFISIKEFILHKLYGEFLVDKSIASGTGMWNMRTEYWDPELLQVTGVSTDRFSRLVEPTYILKGLKKEFATMMGVPVNTPGVIGAADGPLTHLGSTALRSDVMSLTVGTSGALRRTVNAPSILRGKEAWCYYLAEDAWILGAVSHDAGLVMKWFFDRFLQEKSAQDEPFDIINEYAGEVSPGAEGLLFFPFLGGERSPRYNPSARGALLGISYRHGKKHFIRALMEGIAFRLYSNYRMLDPGGKMELVLTGGILKSPFWMQLTADFFGKRLWIPDIHEAACWGAVLLGLKAFGYIKRFDEMRDMIRASESVEFNAGSHRIYRDVYRSYEEAYTTLFTKSSP